MKRFLYLRPSFLCTVADELHYIRHSNEELASACMQCVRMGKMKSFENRPPQSDLDFLGREH